MNALKYICYIITGKKISFHCNACGCSLFDDINNKRTIACYKAYNKSDVYLCWSCNYDYKKFAQDARTETFYHIMKGL